MFGYVRIRKAENEGQKIMKPIMVFIVDFVIS